MIFIDLFLEIGEGRETERERNSSCLSHAPQPETWPETQARDLSRNQTGDLSLCEMMPNQLGHTSQGSSRYYFCKLK